MIALPPHPPPLPEDIRPALQHQLGVPSIPAPRSLKPHEATTRTREYAGSCAQNRFTPQTERKRGRRSTMCSTTASLQPLSQTTQSPLRLDGTVFTFLASPKPTIALTFSPRPSPPQPRKRCRAIADIDGEQSNVFRKKRRLRLFLITSRLSPEFSHPASNIVDRGSSKIAVWAKQKALGRNLLRKAAILNRIRRRAIAEKQTEEYLGRSVAEQEKDQKQLELAKLAFVYGSHDIHARPIFQRASSFPPTAATMIGGDVKEPEHSKPEYFSPNLAPQSPNVSGDDEEPSYRSPNDGYAFSYLPPQDQFPRKTHPLLPPSPLGLSNYDAFDLEDDIPDPYAHLDDDEPDEQDEDIHDWGARSPSASTTASYASTLSTAPTGTHELAKTPPRTIYSDFNILDPEEPVLRDCDQIDRSVCANTLAVGSLPPTVIEQDPAGPASCSPNFVALFAMPNESPPGQAQAQSENHEFAIEVHEEQGKRKERQRQTGVMFLHFNT